MSSQIHRHSSVAVVAIWALGVRIYSHESQMGATGAYKPAQASTPMPPNPNRRETLLELIEMLLKPSEGVDQGETQALNFGDDKDTLDERSQVVGAEVFNGFQAKVNNMDMELRNLAGAARKLGSSVAILSSALRLRNRFAQLLFLYRENAASLFPRKIAHDTQKSATEAQRTPKFRRSKRIPPQATRPTVNENLDPEHFPDQLQALRNDLATFLSCLDDFPEFTDEAMNASICSFEDDLKYWASCLTEYSGQFRYPSVQRYIHELSMEMGEHIDTITTNLSVFIEVGIPTIQLAQKHGAIHSISLTAVATLFSVITATTLQFSFRLHHAPLADAVNCFWFSSLVFSIAAAVNGLLGITWKQAMHRSPRHRVPWWILIWIKRLPLVFLVIAVICFSVGLCCFTYASEQAFVTSILTTALSGLTSIGFLIVLTWFTSERFIFLRHRGTKWLGDALAEYTLPGGRIVKKGLKAFTKGFRRTGGSVYRFSRNILVNVCMRSKSEGGDELESTTLPLSFRNNPGTTTTPSHTAVDDYPESSSFAATFAHEESSPQPLPSSVSTGKQLWKNALKNVAIRQALSSSIDTGIGDNPRLRSTSATVVGSISQSKNTTLGERPVILRSRLNALQPKIERLQPTQDVDAHQAPIRHLQFSPNGSYLASASWDRTCVTFHVGDFLTFRRILAHPQGFIGQVAWSPSGAMLLTQLSRGIKIWTEDGVCKKTIDRRTSVESIAWIPDESAFISAEDNLVTKLDLSGKVLDQYDFGHLKLRDVAITPDSLRLIGVGPLLASPSGLQPSKARTEKRLIVYNMETKQIESQTPVLNDVQNVEVVQSWRSNVVALISYEGKAPPQLWKLELLRDRNNDSTTARLILRQTYMLKVQVDSAGPSHFGGRDNELVVCAGRTGDIHIWDRESGALLRHIRTMDNVGQLTCIAWNRASQDPFMFVTGSHDGTVRVWTEGMDHIKVDPNEAQHGSSTLHTHEPFIPHTPHDESELSGQDQVLAPDA